MRKVSVLVATCLFLSSCTEKIPENNVLLDLFTPYAFLGETLHGRVKSVNENLYWAGMEDGKVVKGKKVTTRERDSLGYSYDFRAEFDENGLLASCQLLDENGDVVDNWKFTAENLQWIKGEYFKIDTLRSYVKFTYDTHNFLTQLDQYTPATDTVINRFVISNDSRGRYTTIVRQRPNGELRDRRIITRDPGGRILTNTFYAPPDSFQFRSTQIYNDKGFYETQLMESKGNPSEKFELVYTYDESGNWITAEISRGGILTYFCERQYTYY
ncbi:MAG: hypothetical protein U0T82_08980 [Bacteroidales bacterium]